MQQNSPLSYNVVQDGLFLGSFLPLSQCCVDPVTLICILNGAFYFLFEKEKKSKRAGFTLQMSTAAGRAKAEAGTGKRNPGFAYGQ